MQFDDSSRRNEKSGDFSIQAEIIELLEGSERLIKFSEPIEPYFSKANVPLPPYIHEKLTHPERYQTVYAKEPGSAAAPTAGLHFTPQLLDELKAKGVNIAYVTLHVGLGKDSAPVTEDDPETRTSSTPSGANSRNKPPTSSIKPNNPAGELLPLAQPQYERSSLQW